MCQREYAEWTDCVAVMNRTVHIYYQKSDYIWQSNWKFYNDDLFLF